LLNGKEIPALLDTGSTVSTVSESCYCKHLASSIPLKSRDNILDVECAGGTPLPYKGYIEANIKMPGDTNTTCQHVMLVVPDSRYSQHIPALIGTNILNNLRYHLQEEHGVRYLQNAALTTPWFLTFRCLSKREKELTKNNDRLAVIRTCNRITILPNNSIEAEGYLDNEIPYKSTPSIIQSTDLAEHKDISTETTLELQLQEKWNYYSETFQLD
jgi:hypothetical protein